MWTYHINKMWCSGKHWVESTWGLVLSEVLVTCGGFWHIFPVRKGTTVNWLLSENYSQDVQGRGVDGSDHGTPTSFTLMGGVRAGEKRTGEIQQGLRWGERLRGLRLKRSPLKKLMESCNVFMKGKKKKHLSRETWWRSQLKVRVGPWVPSSYVLNTLHIHQYLIGFYWYSQLMQSLHHNL